MVLLCAERVRSVFCFRYVGVSIFAILSCAVSQGMLFSSGYNKYDYQQHMGPYQLGQDLVY